MINVICLFLLLVIIGILIWYVKSLLGRVMMFVTDIRRAKKILKDFDQHLEYVYNLETFHGDATLEALLKHSKKTSEKIRKINLSLDSLEQHESGEEE